MNSLINSTNRDIEELQKTLKNIDLEISEKVRLNQDKMIESAKLEMAVNNLHSMLVNNRKEMREAGLEGGDDTRRTGNGILVFVVWTVVDRRRGR